MPFGKVVLASVLFSRQIFGRELVETRLVFLSDSSGGHDAGLSARLARRPCMGR